jgi:hypothetical protein
MDNIFSSASKIVLLALIGGLVLMTMVLTTFIVISGRIDPKDQLTVVMAVIGIFSTSISGVLGYYFGVKSNTQEQALGGK